MKTPSLNSRFAPRALTPLQLVHRRPNLATPVPTMPTEDGARAAAPQLLPQLIPAGCAAIAASTARACDAFPIDSTASTASRTAFCCSAAALRSASSAVILAWLGLGLGLGLGQGEVVPWAGHG